jgi:hypothetical protein
MAGERVVSGSELERRDRLGLADHIDARAPALMRALDREAQGRSPPNVTGATPISPTYQEGGEGA